MLNWYPQQMSIWSIFLEVERKACWPWLSCGEMLACIDELRPWRACRCADPVRGCIIPAYPPIHAPDEISHIVHKILIRKYIQLSDECLCLSDQQIRMGLGKLYAACVVMSDSSTCTP